MRFAAMPFSNRPTALSTLFMRELSYTHVYRWAVRPAVPWPTPYVLLLLWVRVRVVPPRRAPRGGRRQAGGVLAALCIIVDINGIFLRD